ncbi:MAG: hypothetical protein ACI9C4_001233, partial [Paraglaciecola sp.]
GLYHLIVQQRVGQFNRLVTAIFCHSTYRWRTAGL